MTLPHTAHALYAWQAALTAMYLVVAWGGEGALRRLRGENRYTDRSPADILFNSGTFSASALILLGIYDEAVFKLIGDTTAYLITASLVGLGYSLINILPRRKR